MRLIIVEDEPLIAQRLERLVREILGDQLESLNVAATFEAASARLAEAPIDLLLLDLNLRGQDGMQLLQTSVASAFHTIIVSANIDQAIRAFEHGVIDFVPKPFTRERLAQALQRVTLPDGRAANAAKYLAVRKHGKIVPIAVERVVYVEGAGSYAELVLDDGTRHLHDKTLEKLHALLPADFERIHKSYLARLSTITALHASEGSHYEAELRGGLRLPIGRTRYKQLKEMLQ
jgi:DNA-binding LytR/AlgR family response regulator